MAPGEPIGPGASVPPLMMVVGPTVPVPASTPPLLTVNGKLLNVPVTFSVPCCTVHGSTSVLVPVSVQIELSTLLKVPNPRYC